MRYFFTQEEFTAPEERTEADVAQDLAVADNSLISASDDARDIAETGEEASAIVGVASGLDDLAERVETRAEAGEIDEFGAAAVTIAAEELYGRLSLKSLAKKRLSVESFSTAGSSKKALTAAAEGWKEDAKAFIEKIIANLAKLAETVKNFFKNLLDANGRYKKRAEELLKKADDAQAKKIKCSALLAIGDKVGSTDQIVSTFEKIGSMNIFGAAQLEWFDADLKKIADLVGSDAEEAAKKSYSSFVDMLKAAHNTSSEVKGDFIVYETELQFAGRKLVTRLPSEAPTSAVKSFLNIGQAKVSLEGKSAAEAAEIDALDAGQIKKVLAVAIKVLDKQADSLAEYDKIGKSVKEAADKFLAASKDAESEDAKKLARAAASSLTAKFNCISAGNSQFAKYQTLVAKAVIDLAAASIGAPKEEKTTAALK